MGELSLLSVLVLIAASVLTLAVFRRLGVPPMLGYVLVGAALGPAGLAFIPEVAQVRLLAEFGVAFLLFTLGLEFSLPRLKAMGSGLLWLGGLQIGITTLLVVAIGWAFGIDPKLAMLFGGAIAMSSTAVAIHQLAEQGELSTRHGSLAVGMLIFQDLAVVPFLALVPALADDGRLASPLQALGAAVVVLGVVLATGHWLLRPLMAEIARARMAELFTLAVLLVVLGASWATHAVGLSLALGAFLAGLMLAETQFRHQVEVDIRPFRDLLLGLFFISVGMTLNPAHLARWLPAVLALLAVLVAGKAALIALLVRRGGHDREVALRTGLALGQGGEFGIAILTLVVQRNLVAPEATQPLLVAIVLSMAVSPLLMRRSGSLAARITGVKAGQAEPQQEDDEGVRSLAEREHVLLCGFGRVGQNLARILEEEGFEYVAVELDPERARLAREAGDAVIWGDASNRHILQLAGLQHARVVVVTLPSGWATLQILHTLRGADVEAPILVRARDDTQLELLQQAGATEVVPETLEASMMLASHMLAMLKVPIGRVVRKIQRIRDDRYVLLRTVFRGGVPGHVDPERAELAELQTVALPCEAASVGRRLDELALEQAGVMVTAIRRDGIVGRHPLPETVLKENDVLVLFGRPDDLERGRSLLISGE
jgi:CPA2 family monovalent cation:H+ antiporter-2